MADYDSAAWRAVLDLPPPPRKYYAIEYVDGHVELFTHEEARAMKLAKDPPGTVAAIRYFFIPERDTANDKKFSTLFTPSPN